MGNGGSVGEEGGEGIKPAEVVVEAVDLGAAGNDQSLEGVKVVDGGWERGEVCAVLEVDELKLTKLANGGVEA